MCPREAVICSKAGVSLRGDVDGDATLNFAHGHAMHWVLQNSVLPSSNILRGRWKCLHCGATYGCVPGRNLIETAIPRPSQPCPCGKAVEPDLDHDWLFMEVMFQDHVYGFSGHPDGFLALPGHQGLGVFEAKSISERGFAGIKDQPMLDHVIQMHGYFGLTNLSWGRILYWCKGKYGFPALREHYVERNDELVAKIQKTCQSVQVGVETGILPAGVCSSAVCARAQTCVARDACFGITPPTPGQETSNASNY